MTALMQTPPFAARPDGQSSKPLASPQLRRPWVPVRTAYRLLAVPASSLAAPALTGTGHISPAQGPIFGRCARAHGDGRPIYVDRKDLGGLRPRSRGRARGARNATMIGASRGAIARGARRRRRGGRPG